MAWCYQNKSVRRRKCVRIFGGGDIKEVEECCSWDNTREMANKLTVFITHVQVEPTKQWRITFVVVFKWGII